MLRITNQREVPPTVKLPDGREGRGFWYVQPESNHLMCCDYLEGLLRKVREHRIANRYPLGTNWEMQVEDFWCKNNQGVRVCEEDRSGWNQPLVLMARAAHALLDWAKQGFHVVSKETFMDRWNTCRGTEATPRCEFYNGDRTFGAVACKFCSCSGLKLFLPGERCPKGKWKI